MADDVIKTLYGKILLITIPLLTLGGMILGYLIMTSRTSGGVGLHRPRGHAPLRRRRDAVGPRDLPRLGLAQFVTATDLAMVGVSIPGNAVGGSDAWPAAGGVFQVLQNGELRSPDRRGPEQLERRRLALGRDLRATVLMTFSRWSTRRCRRPSSDCSSSSARSASPPTRCRRPSA